MRPCSILIEKKIFVTEVSYRIRRQHSVVRIDFKLVVLRHDGVPDLAGRPVAVRIGRKHLDYSSP